MTGFIPEKKENQPLTPEILVPRLGDYLVDKGILSTTELERALIIQSEERKQGRNILLGELLVNLGLVDRIALDAAVTEQIIQLRAALQETNAQLERRVQERTQELQNALQKLSELNQLKSNFIANISHELRTPLTHIKGYIELLISGAMGDLPEAQFSALKVVEKSTNRLEQQIEDLIRFSLAARGEFTLKIVPISLQAIADQTISRLCEKASEKHIILFARVPPNLPPVKGDLEKISWAIMQLVDNAIKFTPDGGRVSISTERLGQGIDLRIDDTGIGIPTERYNEIYEPFHQLDGSATRRYGGTGLGLALVRQIIEAHGSSIELESTIGKGTRFHFILPMADISTA